MSDIQYSTVSYNYNIPYRYYMYTPFPHLMCRHILIPLILKPESQLVDW